MSVRTALPDLQQPAAALRTAVTIAGLAPSVQNTQPWRWRIRPGSLDLLADRRRQLTVTDPDRRLLTVSCGAALHHAEVVLAAQGHGSLLLPVPDPRRPDHLARLCLAGPARVSAATMRLYQAIGLRSTDRRPGGRAPVDDTALLLVTLAVQAHGCFLWPLRRDQVVGLAAAVGHAQQAQAADAAWRAETARWAGGARREGAGVPDASIPERRPCTAVAGRDFGRAGTLPVGDGTDGAATYAILYGALDEPVDWLNAGRALSHAWLTATDVGVSVLPVSAPVEVPADRETVRGLLPGAGYPYLVLRLTQARERGGPAPTPRLPLAKILAPDGTAQRL